MHGDAGAVHRAADFLRYGPESDRLDLAQAPGAHDNCVGVCGLHSGPDRRGRRPVRNLQHLCCHTPRCRVRAGALQYMRSNRAQQLFRQGALTWLKRVMGASLGACFRLDDTLHDFFQPATL